MNLQEATYDLQISDTSSSANSEQNEINEMVLQNIHGAEHNGRVCGLGLGPTPVGILVSYQNSLTQVLQLLKVIKKLSWRMLYLN